MTDWVVVELGAQRDHAAGSGHTARGCGLGTLQNVPPCPPTHLPLLRSQPDLSWRPLFPRESTLFLGGDPGQGLDSWWPLAKT